MASEAGANDAYIFCCQSYTIKDFNGYKVGSNNYFPLVSGSGGQVSHHKNDNTSGLTFCHLLVSFRSKS